MAISSHPLQRRERPIDHVPEADRGLRPWMMLLAVSITHMFTWGFTISFGIFREFYFQDPVFKGDQAVAQIGVVGTGIIQAMCPFLIHILGGRPWLRPILHWSGTSVVVAAAVASAFARTPLALIMTQGVLYGIGSGLVFAPNLSYIDEWFIERRSLASGLFFMSVSLTAAIISPVLRILLQQYSAKAVLLGWAILVAITLIPAIAVIRSRLRRVEGSPFNTDRLPSSSSSSYSFVCKPIFWLVLTTNSAQAMSQYLPAVYLPSFATQVVGASAEQGAYLLTAWHLASVAVQPLIGLLADKSGLMIPALVSTLIPGLTTLCIWPYAVHYWLLIITALLFGSFSGGFVVLRSGLATLVVDTPDRPHEELIVSGLIMFVRGCSTVASGYMGVALVSKGAEGRIDKHKYGAGVWRLLLITIGVLACSSSTVAIVLRKRSKENNKDRSTASIE